MTLIVDGLDLHRVWRDAGVPFPGEEMEPAVERRGPPKEPYDYKAQLEAQDGKCAICGVKEEDTTTGLLYRDHDHVIGKWRGLLCQKCNTMLGFAKDSPEILQAAIEYLTSWN